MAIFKITQEEINQYMARFEGSVPLVIYPRGLFTYKYQLHFVESEIDLKFGLSQIQDIKPNTHYKIVAGFEKTKLEDFINLDWFGGGGGIPMTFNKRLVNKMRQLCPNDFIALPITIINLSDQVDPYQNNDFYIVNPLNTLDAIDKEKSTTYIYSSGTMDIKKRIYKKNPWQGHLIAFDKSIRQMIFHPTLAKELYPSKQFHFLTPEEDSFWMGGGYPNGHNKDTFSYWMNGVEKAMAYPRKSLYKFMGDDYT